MRQDIKTCFNRPVASKDKTNPIVAKILLPASHLWGGCCCCILSVVCVMFTLTQLKETNGRTMQWLVNWARFFSRSRTRFVSTLADKNKLSKSIPTCVASLYLIKVDKEAQTNLIESTCWCLLECQQSKWLLDLKLECFSFTIHKGHCNSAPSNFLWRNSGTDVVGHLCSHGLNQSSWGRQSTIGNH